MAVEIGITPKRLSRHAAPVTVLSVAVLVLSVALLGQIELGTTFGENAIARGAVSGVVHIAPAPPGFAKVTFGFSSATDSSSSVGSSLGNGIAEIGRGAQLSFNLQASAASRQ